jgi:hypothetical protein
MKTQQGMANFRARLQAAHSKLAQDQSLSKKQREEQKQRAEEVKRHRVQLGEVA